jgi:hypothetical protein
VTGNTFQNIDGSIWANEAAFGPTNQHRGLVIEDAWGTNGVSDVTVTGNTFQNIDAADGTIAFQRFTGGSPVDTATIDRLNDVDIHGNAFASLGGGVNPVYINPAYFGAGAVLPASFDGANLLLGTSGNDVLVDASTGDGAVFADAGNDTITGGTGNDFLSGGAGIDTAVYTAAVTNAAVTDDGAGHFVVATGGAEGTDTLTGVEKIDGAGTANILLVGNDGYATIQAAIDAAAAGDTIVVGAGTFAGATINKEVTIIGQGAGQTIITTGAGQNGFQLS